MNSGSAHSLWQTQRDIGLPFNFDSDLGDQGSALDVGFSFDPLPSSEATRIRGSCLPAIELLGFIGLQRFRPKEIPEENRFRYRAWSMPAQPSVASACASQSIKETNDPLFEFRLLYRTDYLKSFLPANPLHGADHG